MNPISSEPVAVRKHPSRAQIESQERQWRGRFATAIAADCTHQEAVLYANAILARLEPSPAPVCDVLVKGFTTNGQCLSAERFQPAHAGYHGAVRAVCDAVARNPAVVRLLVDIALPS
jgi:hypothetical protein